MSKSDAIGTGNYSQHMVSSILYTSLKLDDDPIIWMDATAAKAAVERLDEVHLDYFRPLDEVKEQLNVNPGRHMEFIDFGGANVWPKHDPSLTKVWDLGFVGSAEEWE